MCGNNFIFLPERGSYRFLWISTGKYVLETNFKLIYSSFSWARMLLALLNRRPTSLCSAVLYLKWMFPAERSIFFVTAQYRYLIEMLILYSYRRRDSREDRYRDYDRERRGARRMGRSRYTQCSCILCLLPLKCLWVRGHPAWLELHYWVGHLCLVGYHKVKNWSSVPVPGQNWS